MTIKKEDWPAFAERFEPNYRSGKTLPSGGSRMMPPASTVVWLERLQRPSFRILMAARWRELQLAHAQQRLAAIGRSYRPHGDRMASVRLPEPPVAALAYSEVETMYLAGFRSLRAWRKALRYGGFPEPIRVTPDGPIWTERQLAEWLGVDSRHGDPEDALAADEARLLRQLEEAA